MGLFKRLLVQLKKAALKIRKIIFASKRRRNWVFLLLALFILSSILGLGPKNHSKISATYTVQRGEVKKEISITGKVEPAAAIDLSLEKGGKIYKINVSLGQEVKKNQILAQLETTDVLAQLKQAQANLNYQEAKLEELEKGSRPEEINISEVELQKAQNDLANAYEAGVNTLKNIYDTAKAIVVEQTTSLIQYVWNFGEPYYDYTFKVCDENLKKEALTKRAILDPMLNNWQKDLNQVSLLNAQPELIDQLIIKTKSNLSLIKDFLDKVNESLTINCSLTYYENLTLNQNQALLNTALSNLATLISKLNNLENTLNGYKLTVKNYEEQLALKKAGATPEQIKAQEAQVEQARANVSYYEALWSKSILKAPFDGRITKINFSEGDMVGAGTPIISMIGQGALQIETYIPESEISQVKVGQPAKVTLDAYGNDVVFNAHVVSIDLASTILEGVATYKTILQFDNQDERILVGLTSNVDILVAQKENVLYLPSRYILSKDDKKYVNLVIDKKHIKEVEVQTGLRGSDGRTEIISGLKEKDEVALID